MKFAFRLVVQLNHSEGTRESKEEIYAELASVLESADPGTVEVNEGVYDVVEWAVHEDIATQSQQAVGQEKPKES